MAQRMESVAPPGGVMLGASTVRLVEGAATLGDAQLVQIKGGQAPVPARELLGIGGRHRGTEPVASSLVGRRWEMSAVEGLLDRAIDDHGAVVGVVGPPGIGKSRLVREVSRWRDPWSRGVHRVLRVAHQSGSFPCSGRCCAAPLASKVSTQEARVTPHGFPMPTPTIWRCYGDLLGIADPEWRFRRSIRMRVGED